MKPVLSVKGLSVQFGTPRGVLRAVKGVSLTLQRGEIFVLLGETGCGKSVTGRAIMGLLGDNAKICGSVRLKEKQLLTLSEKEYSFIRGNIATIILQNPDLALNPVLPVGRQLIEPLKHHWKMPTARAKIRVLKELELMGFNDAQKIFTLYPFQLSGGMNQRVLIAAAMLTEPELLIADEPTRALDAKLKEEIKKRLIACRDEYGTAILLITHDLDLASTIARRAGVMYAGQLVEENEMLSLLKKPRHPYAIALLESYQGRGVNDSPNIKRPVPILLPPAEGCCYEPLCPFKKKQCKKIEPELFPVENGMVRCLLYRT